MRLAELEERENACAVLAATLARGWTEQFGSEYRVTTLASRGAQPWRLQPLLSIVYSPPASAAARRFGADLFRWSPSLLRYIPQWVVGTALATGAGLACASRAVLWATPVVPGAQHRVVLPGNARVRMFDFAAGRTRVLSKAGYSVQANLTEIAVRARGCDGPHQPITAFDPAGAWFEEGLVEGHVLARSPSPLSRRRSEARAFQRLHAWLKESGTTTGASEHVAHLMRAVEGAVARYGAGCDSAEAEELRKTADALGCIACRVRNAALARTHGDFQPGNIIVKRDGDVLITDWEYSTMRAQGYDWFVYGLVARSPEGLARRVRNFVDSGTLLGCAKYVDVSSRRARSAEAAMFLLEDLLWGVTQPLSWPAPRVSRHVRLVTAEAREVLPVLSAACV